MKTLADFKRAMRIGTKWSAYNHYYNSDMGIRECSIAQTNRFAFKTIKNDGEICNSWCDFPKASDIEFTNDTVVIWGEGAHGRCPIITYKLIEVEE